MCHGALWDFPLALRLGTPSGHSRLARLPALSCDHRKTERPGGPNNLTPKRWRFPKTAELRDQSTSDRYYIHSTVGLSLCSEQPLYPELDCG